MNQDQSLIITILMPGLSSLSTACSGSSSGSDPQSGAVIGSVAPSQLQTPAVVTLDQVAALFPIKGANWNEFVVGNDNTLCESGKTCVYQSNIGSYQGHCELVSAGSFTNGVLSGIAPLRYAHNGCQ